MAWQVRPKHHVLHHMSQYMCEALCSVRFEHCFRDEAAMGTAKSILAIMSKLSSSFVHNYPYIHQVMNNVYPTAAPIRHSGIVPDTHAGTDGAGEVVHADT